MASKPLNCMNKTVMKLRSPSQTRHFRSYILPNCPISSTTRHVFVFVFSFFTLYDLYFSQKNSFKIQMFFFFFPKAQENHLLFSSSYRVLSTWVLPKLPQKKTLSPIFSLKQTKDKLNLLGRSSRRILFLSFFSLSKTQFDSVYMGLRQQYTHTSP